MSDRRMDGDVFDLCTRLFPEVRFATIQVNHNVRADWHKDRNVGDSWVFLCGAWSGGELVLATGERYNTPGYRYRTGVFESLLDSRRQTIAWDFSVS